MDKICVATFPNVKNVRELSLAFTASGGKTVENLFSLNWKIFDNKANNNIWATIRAKTIVNLTL